MPDLLLLGHDSKNTFSLEEEAKRLGFRTKCIFEATLVFEWLKLREFDALCLPLSMPLDNQLAFADILWRANPLAALIAYDLESPSRTILNKERLFGVDVVSGPDALKTFAKVLQKIKPRANVKAQDFRILVVDDLDSPRDIICSYIESLGFPSVVGAASAGEALEILRNDPAHFSSVVTDIRMPHMTGEELIRKLRADKRLCHLPVIVLTAYGTVDCLIDCLKAGASGFLVKPPKRQEILREISRAYRLFMSESDPCMVSGDEAESLREILLERGFGLT